MRDPGRIELMDRKHTLLFLRLHASHAVEVLEAYSFFAWGLRAAVPAAVDARGRAGRIGLVRSSGMIDVVDKNSLRRDAADVHPLLPDSDHSGGWTVRLASARDIPSTY